MTNLPRATRQRVDHPDATHAAASLRTCLRPLLTKYPLTGPRLQPQFDPDGGIERKQLVMGYTCPASCVFAHLSSLPPDPSPNAHVLTPLLSIYRRHGPRRKHDTQSASSVFWARVPGRVRKGGAGGVSICESVDVLYVPHYCSSLPRRGVPSVSHLDRWDTWCCETPAHTP